MDHAASNDHQIVVLGRGVDKLTRSSRPSSIMRRQCSNTSERVGSRGVSPQLYHAVEGNIGLDFVRFDMGLLQI
ncbi:hypothetical protein [Streptomyces sp. CAU 1734]|uniref:hypothetical protein n=1 Tax=Streptomyces sp. CAU 1734 TaxID=3140360 RepID=UPI003261B1EC